MLYYKKIGEGAPVFILHGFLGMSDNWLTVGNLLAQHYTVYLIDQRNHGRSPHFSAHSYALMAKDLLPLLESEQLDKVSIVGHSMGGKTAMQFAFQYPAQVKSLIVVDIAPRAYAAGHQYILDALQSVDLSQANSRKEVEAQLQPKIAEAGIRLFLMKNLHRHRDGYNWKMNLPVLVAQYSEINAGLSPDATFEGSALFITGEKSAYVSDSDRHSIQEQFPHAQFASIPGAGHWVHAEQPQMTYQAIRNFLG